MFFQKLGANRRQAENTAVNPFDKPISAKLSLLLKRIRDNLIDLLLIVPLRSLFKVYRSQTKSSLDSLCQFLRRPRTSL